jgi:hypothetical protein
MKRLAALLSILLIPLVMPARAEGQTNPGDYKLKIHVSAAEYAPSSTLQQILTVVIDGKHYRMIGPTSSARMFSGNGTGLLNPGDYKGKLVEDTHKSSFESIQSYELLLPDGKTRKFSVIMQGE